MVKKVNISLDQPMNGSEEVYQIACSTNSGCRQSSVEFFAKIDDEEHYLRGGCARVCLSTCVFARARVCVRACVPCFADLSFGMIVYTSVIPYKNFTVMLLQ